MSSAMIIKNARRILLLGSPGYGAAELLGGLTGSVPAQAQDSWAGQTHEWKLETPYFTANIPIWIEEIQDLDTWRNDYAGIEASEVVSAVGGWIYCFPRPLSEDHVTSLKASLAAISKVIALHSVSINEIVRLAVCMPLHVTPWLEKTTEDWEGICQEFGFEYVDFETTGLNEFGERQGIDRMKEALATNDWADDSTEHQLDDLQSTLDNDDQDLGLGFVPAAVDATGSELNQQLLPRTSNDRGGFATEQLHADDVDDLGRMLSALQAVKEQGASLPEDERKKFAAKAVAKIMRDFDT